MERKSDVCDVRIGAGKWTRGECRDCVRRTNRSERHAPSVRVSGHEDAGRWLLENGADVDAPSQDLSTPLHTAAQHGHLTFVHALLDSGAGVNHVTRDGTTPLSMAARGGYVKITSLLIQSGANVNLATRDHATPLYFAAMMGHLGVIRCLIDAKVNLNKAKTGGYTPLYAAAKKGYADVVEMMLAAGANAETSRWDEVTPLHTAVRNGHLETVKVLIKAPYRWEKRSVQLIHVASERGFAKVLEALLGVMKRNFIDIPGNNGASALYTAIVNGHYDATKVLLDAGASLKQTRARVKSSRAMGSGGTKMFLCPIEAVNESGRKDLQDLMRHYRRSEKALGVVRVCYFLESKFFTTRARP